MSRIGLKDLIFSESFSPERISQLSAELGKKPKSPDLTPEQVQQTIQQFQSLPIHKKKLMAQLMKHPCSFCEKEFNTPNVGWSHGMCQRHKEEVYKNMKMTPRPSSGRGAIDLSEFSPEEQKLAVNLFSIVKKQRERQKHHV